jgi:hypothetical protein
MLKRGQFWYIDFIIGILVIAFIGILFARSIIDIPQKEGDLQLLTNDAINIGNLLMSPSINNGGWINGQGKIGLVEDGKVNLVWLDDFLRLVETGDSFQGYSTAKYLLGVDFDFAVYFERKNGQIYNNKAYGGVDDIQQLLNLEAENIVKLIRVVYFDDNNDGEGELLKMNIVVWDYGREKLTSEIVCSNAEQYNFCIALDVLLPDYYNGCQCEWYPNDARYCGLCP